MLLNPLYHFNLDGCISTNISYLVFHSTVRSGVTRVGDTRGGNWGCHPSIVSWKTWFFLVASSAVSPLIPASQKLTTFFAHRFIVFYCFHSGVTPLEGVILHLLPVRPRFSTVHSFFPSGVTPLEGVTRGGPPPRPRLVTPLAWGANAFTNYHIKTLMLWACEMKPGNWWTDDLNLVRICVELLHVLAIWLNDARCANYFNLLDYYHNSRYTECVATKLMLITEPWLVAWFIRERQKTIVSTDDDGHWACKQLECSRNCRPVMNLKRQLSINQSINQSIDRSIN